MDAARQPDNRRNELPQSFLFSFLKALLRNRSRRRYRLLCGGVCWPPAVSVALPVAVLSPPLETLVLLSRCRRRP